jgi:hypothetical protein
MIEIKLTKATPWESLGLFAVRPESCWEFLGNLRRAGLYPDYYAAQVRHEGDRA